MNQLEINIRMIESQIEKQKECKRYWSNLLRWDYVLDCEKNIKELECELRINQKQKIEQQIEFEWDGVFTFMQIGNDEKMNGCINKIDELEKELAVLYLRQGF